MKIRQGFVSNSSSSSFLAYIKDDATGTAVRMFDFMTTLLDSSHGVEKTEISQYRENINNELENLKKDTIFAQKEANEVAKLLDDPLLVAALEKLELAFYSMGPQGCTFEDVVRRERRMTEDDDDDWGDLEPRNILYTLHKKLQMQIVSNKRKKEENSIKLDNIKNLPNTTKLISFTVNHMEDELFNNIKKLEKQGMLVIIEREQS